MGFNGFSSSCGPVAGVIELVGGLSAVGVLFSEGAGDFVGALPKSDLVGNPDEDDLVGGLANILNGLGPEPPKAELPPIVEPNPPVAAFEDEAESAANPPVAGVDVDPNPPDDEIPNPVDG